jgi:group I intron endonuclease
MYHFIYKTTNILNGKYYIGVHSTDNLDDGYLGSGLALKDAIAKYGKENFERVIVEHFKNSEEAFTKERELVNQAFVDLEETYNLKIGGSGGYIGKDFYERYSLSRKGYKHSDEVKDKIRQGKLGDKNPFYGKTHVGDKSRFAHKKNERKVIIDDVTYESCTAASIALNVSKGLISKWIKSGKAIKV